MSDDAAGAGRRHLPVSGDDQDHDFENSKTSEPSDTSRDAGDAGGTFPTMWTASAVQHYRAKVAHLIEALTAHAELVSTRTGRQRELAAYFASADLLQQAVNDFADAEFDWCGSIPVAVSEVEDEQLDALDEDIEGDAPSQELGVLTVLGRYDYVITDAAALVQQGREAYLQHWDQETGEDAAERVQEPSEAVAELLHGAPLAELEGVPGLQLDAWVSQLIQHDGSTEEEIEEDPFGIAGRT